MIPLLRAARLSIWGGPAGQCCSPFRLFGREEKLPEEQIFDLLNLIEI
jgi:hypothetical protein